MSNFIVTRRMRTWLVTEYCVGENGKEADPERVVLHAVHKQSWKTWINVYATEGVAKETLFSIKARNIFCLAYDVVDAEGQQTGSLVRDSWCSQSWRVVDIHRDIAAQLIGSTLFLCQSDKITPDGTVICELRDEGSFFNARFGLYCCDGSAMNINLILSLGILLLLPGDNSGGAG